MTLRIDEIKRAPYISLPFSVRQGLFIELYQVHSIDYPELGNLLGQEFVSASKDAMYTVAWSGWVGCKFIVKRLWPVTAKIEAAMDAMQEIRYVLDPKDNLR